MRVIEAPAVHAALPYPLLIQRLEQAFRQGGEVPLRQHYKIDNPGRADGMLLVMPAWQPGRHIGIKAVGVYPDNPKQSLPSVIGAYLLFDATTGAPLAVIDGVSLTLRRTGSASALAARFLARPDAAHLLVIGAGALAPHLARAHCAVRRYTRIEVWNRSRDKAEKLAAQLTDLGAAVAVAADLESAVHAADTITCATLSEAPLVRGDWLRPGTHVDLVGGFTPRMREADDETMRRARIHVDTRAGALKEAGDLVDPIGRGVIRLDDVCGDLFDLCRGAIPGRQAGSEITLFKSVGYALEDLAAAELVAERTAP